MSRIRRAFERRFRELLAEVDAREREKGVAWFFARAEERAGGNKTEFSQALTRLNVDLAWKMHRFRKRRGTVSNRATLPVLCDAGLGGLARWLRAAGCDAHWMQDVADGKLVSEAERRGAII